MRMIFKGHADTADDADFELPVAVTMREVPRVRRHHIPQATLPKPEKTKKTKENKCLDSVEIFILRT